MVISLEGAIRAPGVTFDLLPRETVMAKALTVKTIENLKPSSSRREIPDGEVRGLYLQVFPSGTASWSFRYRFAGRTRKLTLGASPEIGLKDARDLARKAHLRVAGGEDPGETKKAARTALHAPANRDLVEKVAAQFLMRHVKTLRPATLRDVTRIMNKEIVPAWRGRRLSQIDKPDIHELLDSIVDRPAPVYANRVLAWLKGMCNWAIGRGLLTVNPCAGIKAPTVEAARDRVLSDAELGDVWRAAQELGQPYTEFAQLLILTGQRRNEIARLPWREIDLSAKLWTLSKERAKNRRENQIPLSDQVIAILCSLPRIVDSEFVFTIRGDRPMTAFTLIKERLDALLPADMPPWVLHDVRRTVASGMAKLGINLPVIEKLLNHVSGSFAGIVGVYQRHSFADEKRAAMDAWARHVAALVTDC
jgi:integrase